MKRGFITGKRIKSAKEVGYPKRVALFAAWPTMIFAISAWQSGWLVTGIVFTGLAWFLIVWGD